MMMISRLSMLAMVVAGVGLFGCPANPNVVSGGVACGECVGADVVTNYASASPLPFYPQLCDKMLGDCGPQCGNELVNVINAVATSTNAKVQATAGYAEAAQRRKWMLQQSATK